MKRAVFFDKDGTLVENVAYNVDPRLIRLRHGAEEALPLLHGAGYAVFVVTNQSGVARGFFPESALSAVEERIRELLADFGVPLAGFFYCPHSLDGCVAGYVCECDCRKPQPGLILRAAAEHGIDLAGSWFVGDILDDVEAGNRACCRTVLLDDGSNVDWRGAPAIARPDYFVADLRAAARAILKADASLLQSASAGAKRA